ncbi:MAG: Hsp20/alpha crystallin family protein [Deferrisomatales bacterium]
MTVWDPFREVDRLRQEMDRIFEGARPPGQRPLVFLPAAGARQYPRLNVAETEGGYLVEALAPGVDPETLDVSVKESVLTISGEKKAPEGVGPEAFHRSERAAGRFVRTLDLPADVDAAGVKAAYTEGILQVTLPRAEAAKPRRIAIELG